MSENRVSVLCLSWGSKVMCLGLGWSSGFNSVDQNSSNWHQDPSAHWINPPLSSICSFFVFFISSIHFFIHSVDFWKGRGDMSWGMYVRECWFFFSFPLKKKDCDFNCNICRLQGHWQLYFLSAFSLSLSLSPCEIDRLFVRSSNGAAEGFRALLATRAEQKCCWGKR